MGFPEVFVTQVISDDTVRLALRAKLSKDNLLKRAKGILDKLGNMVCCYVVVPPICFIEERPLAQRFRD